MTSPYAVVRLGHLVPERRPVVVERPNPLWLSLAEDDPRRASVPETVDVIIQAYVFGPRCPGVIKAELASIEETYLKALAEMSVQIQDVQNGAAPSGTATFVVAWHTFLRESIQALVPGLTAGEADVLASSGPGDDGPGIQLMRTLGLSNMSTSGQSEEAPPGPEVPGEAGPLPITAPSSPSSPASTDSVPASS